MSMYRFSLCHNLLAVYCPSVHSSLHRAVWRVNIGTDACRPESKCCFYAEPLLSSMTVLLGCLCCCYCFCCCGHCHCHQSEPPGPQTMSRHVHVCWAAMPVAWCLSPPSMSPGPSLHLSTLLPSVSLAHVHAPIAPLGNSLLTYKTQV